MHTLGHLATAHYMISIFASAKIEALLIFTNQVILLIVSMRTTLLLSLCLVPSQRRFQFPDCFSSWSVFFQAVYFPGPVFYFTLHNFLLKGQCPYNTCKIVLGSGSHLSPKQVVGAWASPSMACQSTLSSHCLCY